MTSTIRKELVNVQDSPNSVNCGQETAEVAQAYGLEPNARRAHVGL